MSSTICVKRTIWPKCRFFPEADLHRIDGQAKMLHSSDLDVAKAFPNDEAVNAALRLVIQMAGIPQIQEVTANR